MSLPKVRIYSWLGSVLVVGITHIRLSELQVYVVRFASPEVIKWTEMSLLDFRGPQQLCKAPNLLGDRMIFFQWCKLCAALNRLLSELNTQESCFTSLSSKVKGNLKDSFTWNEMNGTFEIHFKITLKLFSKYFLCAKKTKITTLFNNFFSSVSVFYTRSRQHHEYHEYTRSFVKLRLNHWCHMDYFNNVLIPFLAMIVVVPLLSMEGQ